MIRKFLPCLLAFFLLLPGMLRAEVSMPDTLVRRVIEEVLDALHEDRTIQAGDQQRVIALIESKVAPHFDFFRMTSLAVGRAWETADAEQRQALAGEFRTLLVRTYANSLTAYQEQTVSFKLPAGLAESDEVMVRSQINKPGARPIPLDYSLVRSGNDWKVFDVAIANVSLVTNYRNNFASEIDKGGIAGLLKALQDKNRHRNGASPTAD